METVEEAVRSARRRILIIYRSKKLDVCRALSEGPLRNLGIALGWRAEEISPPRSIGAASECAGFTLGTEVGVVVVRGTAVRDPRAAMRRLFAFIPMNKCLVGLVTNGETFTLLTINHHASQREDMSVARSFDLLNGPISSAVSCVEGVSKGNIKTLVREAQQLRSQSVDSSQKKAKEQLKLSRRLYSSGKLGNSVAGSRGMNGAPRWARAKRP